MKGITVDAPIEVLGLTKVLLDCFKNNGVQTICTLDRLERSRWKEILLREANAMNCLLTTEHALNIRLEEVEDKLTAYYYKTNQDAIEKLHFTKRTYNCLKRAGINTITDLKKKTDPELRRIRNLGDKCLTEIREKIPNAACL